MLFYLLGQLRRQAGTVQCITMYCIPFLLATILCTSGVSAQSVSRPLLGNAKGQPRIDSPLLKMAGTKPGVALLSDKNSLLIYRKENEVYQLSSEHMLDGRHCSRLMMLNPNPATILVSCLNSIYVVKPGRKPQIVKHAVDSYILETQNLGDNRVMIMTSQGGGYNYGRKAQWISADPEVPRTGVYTMDLDTLETTQSQLLPRSCYQGNLLLDAVHGPLAYCIKSATRRFKKTKAVDTTITVVAKQFKIARRYITRGDKAPHFIPGHIRNQRIPELISLNVLGQVGKLEVMRLSPVAPPRLQRHSYEITLRSPVTVNADKPQFLVSDVDHDLQDEIIIAEENGIEIFKVQHGKLDSIAYAFLGEENLSNRQFQSSQLGFDDESGKFTVTQLKESEAGWNLTTTTVID